ncbi:DUF4073 domain-containing protein [Streptomyces sp. NBC_01381]|uniref:DUF4073 domain-containing protein n=1 Tax=Streptomyces sp. NBC_01381 TaxID=2903845 RepID=UPI0022543A22|nr:DUF4073 domain-containing protein [Streptomyces sp. NBC_01381]MCX4667963.1 DUF4073 domain-containing protein [Streptomyces sp. NBC_01381]
MKTPPTFPEAKPPSRRTFLTASGIALATIPLGGLIAAEARAAGRVKAPVTALDVISDIQGDLADFGNALDDLNSFGGSDALVIAGDLVAQGTAQQYDDLYATLADHPHPERVLAALGNHEQYNADPFDTQVKRFLDYTGMPDVYSQTTAGDLPLLFIGTTAPAVNGTNPPFVTLGSSQLSWLDGALKSHADKPYVLIFSHHVLPGSVSGTTGPDAARFYDQDFVDEADLLTILGAHPNVVFFSGHTHWDLNRSDWAAKKIVEGGDPKGFTVVNTGFIQTMYGPDGNGGEKPGSGAESQGLRVLLGSDGKLTVESRDFKANKLIRSLAV